MIPVQGHTIIANLWWDDRDRDPENHGWYIEYLSRETGDCIDDSVKIWHPSVEGIAREDIDGITAVAQGYIAKLESELKGGAK